MGEERASAPGGPIKRMRAPGAALCCSLQGRIGGCWGGRGGIVPERPRARRRTCGENCLAGGRIEGPKTRAGQWGVRRGCARGRAGGGARSFSVYAFNRRERAGGGEALACRAKNNTKHRAPSGAIPLVAAKRGSAPPDGAAGQRAASARLPPRRLGCAPLPLERRGGGGRPFGSRPAPRRALRSGIFLGAWCEAAAAAAAPRHARGCGCGTRAASRQAECLHFCVFGWAGGWDGGCGAGGMRACAGAGGC